MLPKDDSNTLKMHATTYIARVFTRPLLLLCPIFLVTLRLKGGLLVVI